MKSTKSGNKFSEVDFQYFLVRDVMQTIAV